MPPLSEQLPIDKVVNLGLLSGHGGFKIPWLKAILNRVKHEKCHWKNVIKLGLGLLNPYHYQRDIIFKRRCVANKVYKFGINRFN